MTMGPLWPLHSLAHPTTTPCHSQPHPLLPTNMNANALAPLPCFSLILTPHPHRRACPLTHTPSLSPTCHCCHPFSRPHPRACPLANMPLLLLLSPSHSPSPSPCPHPRCPCSHTVAVVLTVVLSPALTLVTHATRCCPRPRCCPLPCPQVKTPPPSLPPPPCPLPLPLILTLPSPCPRPHPWVGMVE